MNRNAKRNNKTEILMIELILLLLGICLLMFGLIRKGSIKRAVKNYMTAYYQEDYSSLYDCMYFDASGKLASKEAFVTAETIQQDKDTSPETVTVTDIEKTNEQSSTADRMVRVSFQHENGKEEVKTLGLVKDGFTWKVDGSDYLLEDISFNTTRDAKLTIDGIPVSEGLVADRDSETLDTYVIPDLFGKTHVVSVTGSDQIESEERVTFNKDAKDYDTRNIMAPYDTDTRKEVANLAGDALCDIVKAAADGESYKKADVFSTIDNDDMKDVSKGNYEAFRDNVIQNYDTYKVDDMDATVCESPSSDGTVICVKIDADATGKIAGQGSTDDLNVELWFLEEKGDWQLYSFKDIDVD